MNLSSDAAQGRALVSALAKLAVPESSRVSASDSLIASELSLGIGWPGRHRSTRRAASLILTSLFAAVITAGVFQTIAHTACCFVIKH